METVPRLQVRVRASASYQVERSFKCFQALPLVLLASAEGQRRDGVTC